MPSRAHVMPVISVMNIIMHYASNVKLLPGPGSVGALTATVRNDVRHCGVERSRDEKTIAQVWAKCMEIAERITFHMI